MFYQKKVISYVDIMSISRLNQEPGKDNTYNKPPYNDIQNVKQLNPYHDNDRIFI